MQHRVPRRQVGLRAEGAEDRDHPRRGVLRLDAVALQRAQEHPQIPHRRQTVGAVPARDLGVARGEAAEPGGDLPGGAVAVQGGQRAEIVDRAESAVLKAGERSWADVVRLVPARRAGGWIASGLRSDAGQGMLARFKTWLVDRLLGQPIGSLERYGREGAAKRITEALAEPVWGWITGKVPEVAANVRVADRVEARILQFPIPELERLVRSITEKELNLIVRLGYFLGAGIGLLLVVIRRFTG